MKRKLKVGTRESALAMAQTRWLIDRIQLRHPDWELEAVPLKTSGDRLLDQPLRQIGGKGLFTKELEVALLEQRIDLAVHSLKDLPAQYTPGLTLAAFSEREDPRDVLISRCRQRLAQLPAGAVIGTSSIRRAVQIRQQRPDLQVAPLRGNVLTRLDQLSDGRYDAIVLAAAGLNRLGLAEQITQYFTVDEMIPAIGQGVLAVQAREDTEHLSWLEGVNCQEAAACAKAERAYMMKLDGGCSTPIAAHAKVAGAVLTITGMWVDLTSNRLYRATVVGRAEAPTRLGLELAKRVMEQLEVTDNDN